MKHNNTAIYIYVCISIVAIGVLIGFLIKCERKTCSPYTPGMTGKQMRAFFYDKNDTSRDMCLCSPIGHKLCANRQQLLMSYDEGNTEYQDLAGKQESMGGPVWAPAQGC